MSLWRARNATNALLFGLLGSINQIGEHAKVVAIGAVFCVLI
jgi:hypothetical protein